MTIWQWSFTEVLFIEKGSILALYDSLQYLMLKGWILSGETQWEQRLWRDSPSVSLHNQLLVTLLSFHKLIIVLSIPSFQHNLMALQTQYLGIDGINKHNSSQQELNLSIDMVKTEKSVHSNNVNHVALVLWKSQRWASNSLWTGKLDTWTELLLNNLSNISIQWCLKSILCFVVCEFLSSLL